MLDVSPPYWRNTATALADTAMHGVHRSTRGPKHTIVKYYIWHETVFNFLKLVFTFGENSGFFGPMHIYTDSIRLLNPLNATLRGVK